VTTRRPLSSLSIVISGPGSDCPEDFARMPCGVRVAQASRLLRSDVDTFAGSCFFASFTVDVEHFYNCAKAIVVSCERHDLDCPPNLNAVNEASAVNRTQPATRTRGRHLSPAAQRAAPAFPGALSLACPAAGFSRLPPLATGFSRWSHIRRVHPKPPSGGLLERRLQPRTLTPRSIATPIVRAIANKGPDSREIARALLQNLRQEALVSL